MKLSANFLADSNDENVFPHKLLLTNTEISKLCKAFENNSATNIKLSKTHLHKTGQSGRFLSRLLGLLQKTGFPLIQNMFKPLAKSVLIPSGLTAAASATIAAIHKIIYRSDVTTLTISREEMNHIIKIIE